ncbi:unnamed protein product [Pedinophyceae sp. YPF-701]|nr:unnamed protein product [Pedinophyceae sp. YPF-701]
MRRAAALVRSVCAATGMSKQSCDAGQRAGVSGFVRDSTATLDDILPAGPPKHQSRQVSASPRDDKLADVEVEVTPRAPGRLGSYTPATMMMWQERIAREAPGSHADQPASADGEPVLEPRAPRKVVVRYPVSTVHDLHELYQNPWGYVRIGRLLEDFDSVAGTVAFLHSHENAHHRPVLVTASVDRITAHGELCLEKDFRLEGRTIWTGRSSMDILIQCIADGQAQPVLEAVFTFVGRDPATGKAAPLPAVKPESALDAEWFEKRQKVNDHQKALRKARQQAGTASTNEPLDPRAAALLAEGAALQDLPALGADDAVVASGTELTSVLLMQPQERNMAGKVFGGHLMGRAYELGFAAALVFSGSKPSLVEVGAVTFDRPVEVGDLIKFTATVLHTRRVGDASRVFVEVEAHRMNPREVVSEVTNRFRFEYEVEGGVKRVLPATEEQARKLMRYL